MNTKSRRIVGLLSSLLLLAIALPLIAAPLSSLRCGSRLVKPGNSTSQLIGICGQPSSVARNENRVPVETYDQKTGKYITTVEVQPFEVWTYNFGPSRLVTVITVKNNVIESMESSGYGW